MTASLAITNAPPNCETLTSLPRGTEGVFIPKEALIESIADLLSHTSVAPDLILKVNEILHRVHVIKSSAPKIKMFGI